MSKEKTFSFELFPPKTDAGFEKLQNTVRKLNEVGPEYFSVTYGAGGSTRDRTFSTVDWIGEQGIPAAPHLSCIGASRDETLEILQRYQDQGIKRIVAIRGDLPSGAGLGGLGDLRHASDLVALIRENFDHRFRIEVAAYPEFHPQSTNPQSDLMHFRHKVEAGADAAITQYFYNPDAYRRFVDSYYDNGGPEIPIVPGIMPIINYTNLARFSDACGAEIPRWIRRRLEAFGDDKDAIRTFGIDVVSDLCRKLLEDGAPGLHFYTMNQAAPTLAIWKNLGLPEVND